MDIVTAIHELAHYTEEDRRLVHGPSRRFSSLPPPERRSRRAGDESLHLENREWIPKFQGGMRAWIGVSSAENVEVSGAETRGRTAKRCGAGCGRGGPGKRSHGERCTALISAAVAGEIDVRNTAQNHMIVYIQKVYDRVYIVLHTIVCQIRFPRDHPLGERHRDSRALWLSQFERGKRTAHVGLVLRTLRELDLAIRIERRSKATLTGDGVPLIDLDAIVGENTNRSGE